MANQSLSYTTPKFRARRRPKKVKPFDAWKRARACHLMTYPECRACGTRDDVVVHHLRYRGKRGESEKPGDLVTLCRAHHNEYHSLYGLRDLVKNTLAYVEGIAQQELYSPEMPDPGTLG